MKITTLTLNPAIDLFVGLDELKPVIVNRTTMEDYQANGKAINISFILKQLGLNSAAMGFLAGFTGDYIEKVLKGTGLDTDFVYVEGITRINVFINAGLEYRIVNKGPEIKKKDERRLLDKLKRLSDNSWLFVSGSIPKGIDDSIFINISKICRKKNIKLIYDISSKKLLDCLEYNPYLIKPNEEELAEFFNKERLDENEIITYSKGLISMGSERVLVSRGSKGSIYIDSKNILKVNALNGKVVNSACAGDTLLGSFIGRIILGDSLENALKYASVASSLTAFSKGLADLNDVKKYINDIKITDLNGGK